MDEAFARACGAAIPLRLEVVDATGVERSVRLGRPFAIIGRDPAADVLLEHPEISLRHVLLQVVEGRLWVVDLGSRLGIARPGGRVEAFGAIEPGESIGVGSFAVRFARGPNGYEPSPGPSGPNRSAIALERAEGAGLGPSWPLDRPITLVGRSPICGVQLDDESVSRVHAAIVRTSRGPWAVDLLGRGGLTIAGVAARHGLLEPAEALGVGRFRLRLRDLDDAPAATPPAKIETWSGPALSLELLPEGAGIPPALLILIEQLGRMQSRMLEQFGAAMQAILSLMDEQRREEVARVRDELARIRGLADELEGLKAKLQEPTAAPPAPTGPQKVPTPDSPPPDSPVALDWVYRRLGEIQGEQERRWGSVLSMIRKK